MKNETLVKIVGVCMMLAVVVIAGKSPIDWYGCGEKANGNYPHPVDCTRFVTCSNEIASERDCAVCEYHPMRCPEGRLIFDGETNQCLFANEAKCTSLCDSTGNTARGRRGGNVFKK